MHSAVSSFAMLRICIFTHPFLIRLAIDLFMLLTLSKNKLLDFYNSCFLKLLLIYVLILITSFSVVYCCSCSKFLDWVLNSFLFLVLTEFKSYDFSFLSTRSQKITLQAFPIKSSHNFLYILYYFSLFLI